LVGLRRLNEPNNAAVDLDAPGRARILRDANGAGDVGLQDGHAAAVAS
jgi:hypothetical protein